MEGDPLLPHPTRGWRRYVALGCLFLSVGFERSAFFAVEDGLNTVMEYLYQDRNHSMERTAEKVSLGFEGTSNFFGIIGGVLADGVLGAYMTTLLGGVIFLGGAIVLLVNAFVWVVPDTDKGRIVFWIFLYVLGIGSSMFKTCMIVLCGKQATLYFGDAAVSWSFAWYYVFLNIGASIACIFVAFVSQGEMHTYQVLSVFALVSITMSLIFLIVGYKFFIKDDNQRQGNRVLETARYIKNNMCSCSRSMMRQQSNTSFSISSSNDYEETVAAFKQIVKMVTIISTVVICFAIYSETMSDFRTQANHTRLIDALANTQHGWEVVPDIFDDVLCLAIVPLLYLVIFPLFRRFGHELTILRKMVTGLVFLALSIVVAIIIQTQIDADRRQFSMWILLPQLCLFGFGEVLAIIPGMEFAYTQAPDGLVSCMMSLYFCAQGLGTYLGMLLRFLPFDAWPWLSMTILGVLQVFSIVLFIVLSRRYVYVTRSDNSTLR